MTDRRPREDIDANRRSAVRRILWVVLGSLCLLIAAIGVFVPVLPTTPLLLLTAACYVRGSQRFHHWLLSNRLFGGYLRDYAEGRGVPTRTKAISLVMLWGVILWSVLRVEHIHIRFALLLVALAVSAHVLTRPTLRS